MSPSRAWGTLCREAWNGSFGAVTSGHGAVPWPEGAGSWMLVCDRWQCREEQVKRSLEMERVSCSVRGRVKSLSMITVSLLFADLHANIWDFGHSWAKFWAMQALLMIITFSLLIFFSFFFLFLKDSSLEKLNYTDRKKPQSLPLTNWKSPKTYKPVWKIDLMEQYIFDTARSLPILWLDWYRFSRD